MDALSLDQIEVFLVVVDEGSFSAAARKLNRAASAITYAVQKMEEQLGTPLFDRAAYRPALTKTGSALLPGARRISREANALLLAAQTIAGGVEPEIPFVVDSMFDMNLLFEPLREFQAEFYGVQTQIFVENLGQVTQLISDGACAFGLVTNTALENVDLCSVPIGDIGISYVASASHPLAKFKEPLNADMLRDHVQLVLTDRSGLTGKRDLGVFTSRTWRLADLGAKHAMIRAGLGYGGMPTHIVKDEIAAGSLVVLTIQSWEGLPRIFPLRMSIAWDDGKAHGPAARWMINRLARLGDTAAEL